MRAQQRRLRAQQSDNNYTWWGSVLSSYCSGSCEVPQVLFLQHSELLRLDNAALIAICFRGYFPFVAVFPPKS